MKKALASPLGATLVRKVDERFLRAAKGAFPLGECLPTPVNAKIRGGAIGEPRLLNAWRSDFGDALSQGF